MLEDLGLRLGVYWGVSENRGPYYGTLKSRILIIRTPKIRYPNLRKVPNDSGGSRLRLSELHPMAPSKQRLLVVGQFFLTEPCLALKRQAIQKPWTILTTCAHDTVACQQHLARSYMQTSLRIERVSLRMVTQQIGVSVAAGTSLTLHLLLRLSGCFFIGMRCLRAEK